MTSFVLSPQIKQLIMRAKANGGETTCDPRAFYPAGHKCAGTTSPVKAPVIPYIKLAPPIRAVPDAEITKSVPLTNGGAVTEIETKDGDAVEVVTDANGGVKKVEVKNKWLIPAAIAAAFFLLGG